MLECLGTGTLVYAINMTGVHPIGIPMMLFVILMAIGPISGGHVNPAVTAGVYVIKYKDWKVNLLWGLLYLAAEFSGALLGVVMVGLSESLSNGSQGSYP